MSVTGALVSYSDSESSDSDAGRDGNSPDTNPLRVKRKNIEDDNHPSLGGIEKERLGGPENVVSENAIHSQQNYMNKRLKITTDAIDTKRDDILPLPGAILSMFENRSVRKMEDNIADHCGRKRSFAHEEGNWATFVYINVPKAENLKKFVKNIIEELAPLEFHLVEDFHISMSRTVVIRHHWITSLMDSLRANIGKCSRSSIELSHFKVFTNDEKTRTFLAIECLCSESLLDYVEKIDESFSEFNLQKYYEDPSFHVSICWALGDRKKDISVERVTVLQEQLHHYLHENPEVKYFDIEELLCKTGNKTFSFPLPR